jgi:hypothetical protein
MKSLFVSFFIFLSLTLNAQLLFEGGAFYQDTPDISAAVDSFNSRHAYNLISLEHPVRGYSGSIGYSIPLNKNRSLYLAPHATYRTRTSKLFAEDTVRLDLQEVQIGLQFITGPKAWFSPVAAGPLGTRIFLFVEGGVNASRMAVQFTDSAVTSSQNIQSLAPYFQAGICYRALVFGKHLVVTPRASFTGYYTQRFRYAAKILNNDEVYLKFPKSPLTQAYYVGVEFAWIFNKKK